MEIKKKERERSRTQRNKTLAFNDEGNNRYDNDASGLTRLEIRVVLSF